MHARRWFLYLFFNLPRGATNVTGALGRSPGTITFGGEVSFLGFLVILLLRCSPLAMRFYGGCCGVGVAQSS